jgi:hypothetical protein
MKICVKIILILCLVSNFGQAENAKPTDDKALEQTQELLKDPNQRKEFIDKTPDAKKTNDDLKTLVGSDQNLEEAYKLAAELFGKITAEANGDPEKMKKLLEEAQKNPAAFANSWSPEQKEKLKSIAEKTPAAVKLKNKESSKGSEAKALPYSIRVK